MTEASQQIHFRSDKRERVIELAVTWALLPLLLWFAGVGFFSSQDRGIGDMLTDSGAGPEHLTAIVLEVLMAGLAGILMIPGFQVVISHLRTRPALLALVGLSFSSTIWSQSPWKTVKSSIFLGLSVLVVIWLMSRFSPRQIMQILMLVGAVCASLCCVVALFFPGRGLDSRHESAWQGVFFSKNHMGRIFVFLLTPAIHFEAQGSLGRLARNAYVVLTLLMIALSQSRGAWLATVVYMAVAAGCRVVRIFRGRDRIVSIMLLILSVLFLAALVAMFLEKLLALVGRDLTLDGRTIIWGVLMQSVLKRPFLGCGYQAFWAGTGSEAMNAFMGVYYQMHFAASYAHSGYFAVLLETGLVGLLLIVLMIIRSLRNGWICLHLQPQPATSWFIGLIIVTSVYNIDEVTFMLPSYLPWIMFLLAVVGLADAARHITVEAPA